MYEQNAKTGAAYLGQACEANAAPQTMADSIMSRLRNMRSNFIDLRASADNAADKIVGSAPTPIQGASTGQIAPVAPPASSFLDGVMQLITDLENIGADAQQHLNRIHRQF